MWFCMFSPQVFPLRNIVERGSRISMMAFISQSEFSAVWLCQSSAWQVGDNFPAPAYFPIGIIHQCTVWNLIKCFCKTTYPKIQLSLNIGTSNVDLESINRKWVILFTPTTFFWGSFDSCWSQLSKIPQKSSRRVK